MPRLTVSLPLAALVLALCVPLSARAQQWPYGYGTPIGVEAARKVATAAAAEAVKNGWKVAVAVVDPSGTLVFYEKMDDTQNGSAAVAVDKSRSAALFRRPTKTFEDGVKGGNVQFLALHGSVPIEGGLPLVVEGKIVGAVGVSGATSAQDGQCAKAGHEALGPVPVLPAPAPATPAAPAKK